MKRSLRTIALGCALTLTPACGTLPFGGTAIENPIAAARTLDQRAFALLNAYAAVVEEATDIVRDPQAPIGLKRALGQAERVATPATEALQIAVVAYINARVEFDAASDESQPILQRAATAAAGPCPRAARLTERFMLNLMLQLQMLLAALSAFLPLVPEESRERAGEVLNVVGKALSAGGAIAANVDDLAQKLAAIRAEVEAMAAAGRSATPEQLDAAMARVRAASAAFREALEIAEAGAA
jgi:hypothetical protein